MGFFDSPQIEQLSKENKKLKEIIESYNNYLEKHCGYEAQHYEYGIVGNTKAIMNFSNSYETITPHTKHKIENYVTIGGRDYHTEDSRYNKAVEELEELKEKYLKSELANHFFQILLSSLPEKTYALIEEQWTKIAKDRKIEEYIDFADLYDGLENIGEKDRESTKQYIEKLKKELSRCNNRYLEGEDLIERENLVRRIEQLDKEFENGIRQQKLLDEFEEFLDNHADCYGECDNGEEAKCRKLRKMFNPPEIDY